MHASTLAARSTQDSLREGVSIAELYERHFRLIWWTVRGAGVADDAVEDVVHDAFIALFHRLPQFDGALPLERWLIGVARNAAFTHRRGGARRRLRAARLIAEDADQPALDERLDQARAWQQLQGFLARLPEDQRDVFTLVELQGESVPAVASALDVKLNTVYARLRLARAKVDRWIADRHGDAQGWLHAATVHAEPKPQQRLRTKLAVLTSLGESAVAPTPWGLGKLPWFAIPAAAIAAAITIAVTVPPPAPQPASSTTAAAARPMAPGAEANPINAATIDPSASIEAARPAAPPSAPAPAPPRARASGARAPSLAAAQPQPAVDDADPPADALWLAQASDALAARDAAGALGWLDRHERAFPGSALAPERAVLRVDALCQSGRSEEAREVAATWRPRTDLPRVLARLEARLGSGC